MDLSEYPELARAAEFHGHLGPYVALGLKIGEFALRELGSRRHFGTEVQVRCTPEPPISCVVDGLQYATGCTLGKGNITLESGTGITVIVTNTDNARSLKITVREARLSEIRSEHGIDDLEGQAVAVWQTPDDQLFEWEMASSRPET
jgi:formylmethanofuran dehydrogenase subunit E